MKKMFARKLVVLMMVFVSCMSMGCVNVDRAPQSNNSSYEPDQFQTVKENNVEYYVFNCNGTIIGSKPDENWWFVLKTKNEQFKDLSDGDFGYAVIDRTNLSGGIAGVNETTVRNVDSCKKISIDELKSNKTEPLMEYDFEHPFVGGMCMYSDYIIANTEDEFVIYKDGKSIETFSNIDDVTSYLSSKTS